MTLIEQYDRLKVRVKLRRPPDWPNPVKPEAEWLDGRELLVEAAWLNDEDSSYPGEWALTFVDAGMPIPPNSPFWLASGDVEIL